MYCSAQTSKGHTIRKLHFASFFILLQTAGNLQLPAARTQTKTSFSLLNELEG